MSKFTLGKAEISRVEEFTLPVDIADLVNDENFVEKHQSWLAPTFLDIATRKFPLVFQSYIVKLNNITLVIDPCVGNDKIRTSFDFINKLKTPYIERFEATGTRPEDVDLVFCSHLHCDHCGWNTKLRNGHWVPTFPNARYVFVRREVERWDPRRPEHQPNPLHLGVFEDSVQPIIDAGLADQVADRHFLTPDIEIEPAYGHTAGHSMLRLLSSGEEVFFVGDVFHHPLQILRPDADFGSSEDPGMAAATRRHLRERLAARNAWLVPGHFPKAGKITCGSEGEYGFNALI